MRGVTVGLPGEAKWEEFPEPELGPGEVLLRPIACGICATDVKLVARGQEGKYAGALGHEIVGRVLAADESSGWQVGSRVVAAPYVPCGICYYCRHRQPTLCTHLFETYPVPGGLAELVRLPRRLVERGLFAVPPVVLDEAAALTEPIGCAIHCVQACQVEAGTSVLVVGDGPMGLLCALVARAYGANPVIIAGLTPHRLDFARGHVSDQVLNVEQVDIRGSVLEVTEGRGADVVVVAVSDGRAAECGLGALRPGGTLNVFAGVPHGTRLALDLRRIHYQELHLTGSFGVGPEHMAEALHLMQTGILDATPLITGRFAFENAPEALAYAARRDGLKALVEFDGHAEARL